MPVWPDAAAVRLFLQRASRRRALIGLLEGAGTGCCAAAVLIAALWTAGVTGWGAIAAGVLTTAVVAGTGWWRASRASGRVEHDVERRAPGCRNLVITSAELIDQPDRVRPEIGARVCRDAARAVAPLDLGQLFPSRRASVLLAVGVVVLATAIAAASRPPTPPAALTGDGSGPAGPSIARVIARVEPPDYAGRSDTSVEDPDRIEVLAGSRVHLEISADASSVSVDTSDTTRSLTRQSTGWFLTEFTATADGFVTLEPVSTTGEAGGQRLIGVSVEPDLAPRVRITAPGRDLFLPDATMRLEVGVEADDDLGLASLAMTYTKVTGSGENFDFATGEVPITVTRGSGRSWTATGVLALDALELEPGDMVVYRGLAADRRPGSLPVESDAFIIEIVAPGEAAAGGFAVDDQRERYALSQRMVIIKTERLIARQASLPQDTLEEEAMLIAAEQRQVRAEFVFMMGGELSEFSDQSDPFMLHEEDEAHGEADIAAGRLANQGRADLTSAVRWMSNAASALTSANLADALPLEQRALDSLQRAFSKSRYILRTLSERESIDLERRLSGVLTDTARGAVRRPAPWPTPRLDALRAALVGVAALGARPDLNSASGAEAITLAQRVLGIDASDDALQQAAAALIDAARALDAGNPTAGRDHVQAAAILLATEARSGLSAAPAASASPRNDQLRGALADTRRGGGSR